MSQTNIEIQMKCKQTNNYSRIVLLFISQIKIKIEIKKKNGFNNSNLLHSSARLDRAILWVGFISKDLAITTCKIT